MVFATDSGRSRLPFQIIIPRQKSKCDLKEKLLPKRIVPHAVISAADENPAPVKGHR